MTTVGGQIRLLPPDVANKIAAGEVVERPAAVLKELVENALDAGATQVDVAIVAGGCRLVSVADDGAGMSRDDALLSIERHATSKIRTAADLERIHTLGFRGEALAAIAAVSRLTLRTRPHDALAGTVLVVSGGKLQDVRETGCAPGTVVEVRDLFFNVPARRKFLRAPQTELAHLRQVLSTEALAHPEVGWRLTIDGRETQVLPGQATLEDRVRELWGEELNRAELRPVEWATADLRIYGYVGTPAVHRGDRQGQYVFVNRRPASAPIFAHAISEAYHALVPADRHPWLFLFLELDPGLVDVNVHPTKREVRFRRPGEVRDALIAAIRTAVAVTAAPPPQTQTPPLPAAQPLLQIADLPAARAFQYPRMAMMGSATPAGTVSRAAQPVAAPSTPVTPEEVTKTTAEPTDTASRSPWAWCRVVGQIGGLYVVLETEDGFVIMDPHAAHERVLFERYMAMVRTGHVESQGLLTPETVHLQPADAERVRQSLELLKKMGFGVAEFGGDAFVMDAVPAGFSGVSARALLIDVAHNLELAGTRGADPTRLREEAIAQAACKAAVRARDRLTLPEIERLVVDLASSEMPYTCPHGRPTIIYTAFKDLARKFGRE